MSVSFLERAQGSFTLLYLLSYLSPGAVLLLRWKCPMAVLASRVAASHIPQLNMGNVSSATEGLTLVSFK